MLHDNAIHQIQKQSLNRKIFTKTIVRRVLNTITWFTWWSCATTKVWASLGLYGCACGKQLVNMLPGWTVTSSAEDDVEGSARTTFLLLWAWEQLVRNCRGGRKPDWGIRQSRNEEGWDEMILCCWESKNGEDVGEQHVFQSFDCLSLGKMFPENTSWRCHLFFFFF